MLPFLVSTCVFSVRLMATRTLCFLENHLGLRLVPFHRSWPGNLQRQDATCCLSQEPPSLLLRMGMYSSQQKVGQTHKTIPPDNTSENHTRLTESYYRLREKFIQAHQTIWITFITQDWLRHTIIQPILHFAQLLPFRLALTSTVTRNRKGVHLHDKEGVFQFRSGCALVGHVSLTASWVPTPDSLLVEISNDVQKNLKGTVHPKI